MKIYSIGNIEDIHVYFGKLNGLLDEIIFVFRFCLFLECIYYVHILLELFIKL